MLAAVRIREHIKNIRQGALFTTRHFLGCGSRSAVDQALYNLVKARVIVRIARGVFMKEGSALPSVYEVAKIKAESFGKQIYQHGADAAYALGFPGRRNGSPTFVCSGRTSSFRFGDIIICLVGASPRKLCGQDSLAGKLIRAMWYLGKANCTATLLVQSYSAWGSASRELHAAAPMLPAWMNDLLHWLRANSPVSWCESRAGISA